MKKFLAFVLALAMIAATGVVAFAARDDEEDNRKEYQKCYPDPATSAEERP